MDRSALDNKRTHEDDGDRQKPKLLRPGYILLAIALIACSGLLAYKFESRARVVVQQPPAADQKPPRDRYAVTTTRTRCLCAKSFEDISALTQPYHEGDAVPEPLVSGRVVWLAQGTSVKPFDIDKDVTTVLVESGDSTGERCHLLTKFVE